MFSQLGAYKLGFTSFAGEMKDLGPHSSALSVRGIGFAMVRNYLPAVGAEFAVSPIADGRGAGP